MTRGADRAVRPSPLIGMTSASGRRRHTLPAIGFGHAAPDSERFPDVEGVARAWVLHGADVADRLGPEFAPFAIILPLECAGREEQMGVVAAAERLGLPFVRRVHEAPFLLGSERDGSNRLPESAREILPGLDKDFAIRGVRTDNRSAHAGRVDDPETANSGGDRTKRGTGPNAGLSRLEPVRPPGTSPRRPRPRSHPPVRSPPHDGRWLASGLRSPRPLRQGRGLSPPLPSHR